MENGKWKRRMKNGKGELRMEKENEKNGKGE